MITYDFIIRFFGDYLTWVLGIGFLLFIIRQGYSQILKNLRIAFEAVASAILSRFVFTEIIRYFYNKPRPFEVISGLQKLIEQTPGGSFPSGHVAFFFAIAGTFFIYNRKWGIAFFVGALLMGVARVYAGIHWPIDIVGGAALGLASSLIINFLARRYQK